jgi:UDP-N-acetylglucosamine 2-epimerase
VKISIILGTRPEIVKFSTIIHECERLHLDYFILHMHKGLPNRETMSLEEYIRKREEFKKSQKTI